LFSGQRYTHYANFFMTTVREPSPKSFNRGALQFCGGVRHYKINQNSTYL